MGPVSRVRGIPVAVAASTNVAGIEPLTEIRITALILHLLAKGTAQVDLPPVFGKCEVLWSASCLLLAETFEKVKSPLPGRNDRIPIAIIVN